MNVQLGRLNKGMLRPSRSKTQTSGNQHKSNTRPKDACAGNFLVLLTNSIRIGKRPRPFKRLLFLCARNPFTCRAFFSLCARPYSRIHTIPLFALRLCTLVFLQKSMRKRTVCVCVCGCVDGEVIKRIKKRIAF